jgi:exodeoxyribonuclease-3
MARLKTHIETTLLPREMPLVLGGDYNIIPHEDDCYAPEKWSNDALFHPKSRAAFWAILHLGLTEAWRTLHLGAVGQYSYWDYVKGRWQKDEGVRIDHFLLSPQAADMLQACEIDKPPRGKEKPSDHTPVVLTLNL